MDKEMLIKWKAELEGNLAELEKQLSGLESERRKLREQLGAVATLLSTMEGGKMADQESPVTNLSEEDTITGFLSGLKGQGWSISSAGGHSNSKIYIASRGVESVNLWLKFSRYYEEFDRYWFGINPEKLESMNSEKGGVILLLGVPDRYLCFSFTQLQQLLAGATKSRTGKKFQVQERKGGIWLIPAGTGEWGDVSRFYGTQSLREIGLQD